MFSRFWSFKVAPVVLRETSFEGVSWTTEIFLWESLSWSLPTGTRVKRVRLISHWGLSRGSSEGLHGTSQLLRSEVWDGLSNLRPDLNEPETRESFLMFERFLKKFFGFNCGSWFSRRGPTSLVCSVATELSRITDNITLGFTENKITVEMVSPRNVIQWVYQVYLGLPPRNQIPFLGLLCQRQRASGMSWMSWIWGFSRRSQIPLRNFQSSLEEVQGNFSGRTECTKMVSDAIEGTLMSQRTSKVPDNWGNT